MPAFAPRMRVIFATIAFAIVAVTAAGVTPSRAAAADQVIAAVGDMACDTTSTGYNAGNGTATLCRQKAVADKIIADGGINAFLPLGDLQYKCGGRAAFDQIYNASFGQRYILNRTYPIPGNHEYHDSLDDPTGTDCSAPRPNPNYPANSSNPYLPALADGYFGYFGARRGSMPGNLPADATNPARGFYTYDLGSWNIIAINTNDACAAIACRGPNAATKYKGSVQERWLREHLAQTANRCVLVYMHYPRWSSNLSAAYTRTADPNDSAVSGLVSAIWTDLYQGGAEAVLSGHTHQYERFHPMNGSGVRSDAFGVRQFAIGNGGVNLEKNKPAIRNSAYRPGTQKFGYLRMTLRDGSYGWQFRAIDGTTQDAGNANCHGAPVSVTAPASGATVRTGARVTMSARTTAPQATSSVSFFLGSTRVATINRAQAQCRTEINTDPAVFYTSPYCVYSTSATIPAVSGGAQTLRAVANSSDPATPGATTTGSLRVNVISTVTGISSTRTGTTSVTRIASPTNGALKDPAYSRSLTKMTWVGPSGIVVANANGSGARVLGGTTGATRPDFALNDTRLIYLKAGSVYSIPVGGGAAQRIAVGRIQSIAVAPGGGRVLYQVLMPNRRTDIFVMNANGTGKRNVTRSRLISERQPTWRNKNVIGLTRKATRWSVYSMSVRGGRQVRITSPLLNCQLPSYSPNGMRLACVTRVSSTRSLIRTMTARGLIVRSLFTRSSTPNQPVWGGSALVAYTAS